MWTDRMQMSIKNITCCRRRYGQQKVKVFRFFFLRLSTGTHRWSKRCLRTFVFFYYIILYIFCHGVPLPQWRSYATSHPRGGLVDGGNKFLDLYFKHDLSCLNRGICYILNHFSFCVRSVHPTHPIVLFLFFFVSFCNERK